MGIDIDGILAGPIERGELIGAAAAVLTPEGTFTGAAGRANEEAAMRPDTLVAIASMTKPMTTLAAMQLVEQGKLDLDAPAGELVPFLGEVQVLTGYDASGKPVLRPPVRPVTLRHLLTHTSGFAYPFSDARIGRYLAETGHPSVMEGTRASYQQPLLFDPGEQWRYGIGIDWAGQLIEAVTDTRVDEYVTATVIEPLGLSDTTFYLPADRADRAAQVYGRRPEGLVPIPYEVRSDVEMVLAGGGIYSTVVDYLRFTRLFLGDGELDGVRLVSAETVAAMASSQCPDVAVTGWRTGDPVGSNDVDFFPRSVAEWGFGFLMNTEPTPEGRSPGSLTWAGIANTFFWIDRTRQIAGVFATQVMPFFDSYALDAFHAVERAVYSG